jgi:hypothetical protein
MRKRIINQSTQTTLSTDQDWLDLKQIAQVEITSEDSAFPIESALGTGAGIGWRAAQPGKQIIRILFDKPQKIKRIHLLFNEDKLERTQEFVLSWSGDRGKSYNEIVRQQYTFSPPNTIRELEDYTVNLDEVTILELRIIPDISGGNTHASLTSLQVA